MAPGNPVVLGLLVIALCTVPQAGLAQQVDGGQLTRVRALLKSSRSELTQQQFLLLSTKLTQTELAYAELTALAEAGAGAATAAEVAGAVLGGAAELLPLLIAIWPATAHAPGIKEEKPKVRAARAKLDEKLKELAQAATQVDAERKAEKERQPPRKKCRCICIGKGFAQGLEEVKDEAECQRFCAQSRWGPSKGICK
jgi:hypothetical protein